MNKLELFFMTLVCLAMLVFTPCRMVGAAGAAGMDLMQGDVRRGSVAVMERGGMTFVALDDVMTRLALAPSPISGGFVVTYSGRKIEFWNGSTAARVNGSVNALAAAVEYDGTHWWGEAASSIQAIKLFLSSASRPSEIRLVPEVRTAKGTPVAPAPQVRAVPAAASPQNESVASSHTGALITRIRWGEQLDAYRAVIDITQQVEATVSESPGKTLVTFRGTSAPDISGKSPWPVLSAASRRQGADTVIEFSHSSDSVKGFWVADPPRYVLDFFFGSSRSGVPAAVADAGSAPQTVPDTQPAARNTKIETTAPKGASGEKTKFLVVVDAGHGGHDGGAVGNKLKEKDMNLLAALQLGISLKALGVDVKLTRQDDRYLKLAERTEFANSANADVFISLHCNAVPKGRQATGTELYLMAEQSDEDALNLAIAENRELSGGAENAEEVNAAADAKTRLLLKILGDMQQSDKINESTTLAEFLYDRIKGVGFKIRNVRQAPFFVLRGAGMPAVLVEMGYITDSGDAKKLNSQIERKKMMDALAQGVKNYLTRRPGEGGNQ
ncbi:MAG: N-acetylmuramoyl-L-alanine amidase [Synergistaceae bacterium]|nr:N-acetylmuramoyl-L-alanine amidase [Synergistaceae bacterium]